MTATLNSNFRYYNGSCVVVRMPCDVKVDMCTITDMFSVANDHVSLVTLIQRTFYLQTIQFWHTTRRGAAVVGQGHRHQESGHHHGLLCRGSGFHQLHRLPLLLLQGVQRGLWQLEQ